MPRPLFTVITANYNSGDKLAATVASVREQNVDAEHWIIDGVSQDGSLDLARGLADQHTQSIRVVSQPDRGVYDAMNTGIDLATGRYLYFLGAGDVMRPGAMRAIAEHLPAHDRGLVYGDTLHRGDTLYDGPFDRRKLIARNICHQGAFYGREVFDLVGKYDLAYKAYADWDLNLRCFGDRRVQPAYAPVLVADFEPGGLSGRGDAAFERNRRRLAFRYYGVLGTAALVAAELYRKPSRLLRAVVGR